MKRVCPKKTMLKSLFAYMWSNGNCFELCRVIIKRLLWWTTEEWFPVSIIIRMVSNLCFCTNFTRFICTWLIVWYPSYHYMYNILSKLTTLYLTLHQIAVWLHEININLPSLQHHIVPFTNYLNSQGTAMKWPIVVYLQVQMVSIPLNQIVIQIPLRCIVTVMTINEAEVGRLVCLSPFIPSY